VRFLQVPAVPKATLGELAQRAVAAAAGGTSPSGMMMTGIGPERLRRNTNACGIRESRGACLSRWIFAGPRGVTRLSSQAPGRQHFCRRLTAAYPPGRVVKTGRLLKGCWPRGNWRARPAELYVYTFMAEIVDASHFRFLIPSPSLPARIRDYAAEEALHAPAEDE